MVYKAVTCKSFRAIMILNRVKMWGKLLPSRAFWGYDASRTKEQNDYPGKRLENASDARYAVQP